MSFKQFSLESKSGLGWVMVVSPQRMYGEGADLQWEVVPARTAVNCGLCSTSLGERLWVHSHVSNSEFKRSVIQQDAGDICWDIVFTGSGSLGPPNLDFPRDDACTSD
jgi:hypothetical protein